MSTCVKPGFNSVTGRVQTERLLHNWWRFVDRTHTADTVVLIRKMELCDTEKDVSLATVGGSLHKSWKCFVANMFILPVLHEGAENTDEKWMRFLFYFWICLILSSRIVFCHRPNAWGTVFIFRDEWVSAAGHVSSLLHQYQRILQMYLRQKLQRLQWQLCSQR